MTDRMTEDRMIFAASCVESAARELDIPAREMYRRMKRVNLVEDYILKHYGSIHTESRKHITEDIVGCLLDWEKTNLFKKYGNKPTFQNQLDYIWHELNTTHKNGLKMLRKSKTVDEAAANALGYYEFSAGPEGAMRALDRTGKNTKWKNPSGSEVMLKGQNYARGLLGMDSLDSYQGYTADVPVKVVPSPMDMAVPNPVAYNPVDYSAMIKPMEVPGLGDAAYVPKEDNNLGLVKLMQDMGYFGSQPSQPLESYVPDAPQEEESLFNMSAPSPQNTMLDGSWFAKGGHLYGGGSELSNDNTEDNTTYNAGFLPELVVTPQGGYPTYEQMMADDYITQYNDNLLTSYDGRPLTVINPGLSRRFQKGANERNEWRKAHPYRAFGDDAITLGLGLAPLWAGAGLGLASAGEAFANTALAANIAKGWTGLMNTSWFPYVDGAATALGAAHGGSEILKGNGSPENVLEVMPMGQAVKPMYNLGKRAATTLAKRMKKPTALKSELDWSPESWFGTRINGAYDAEDVAALQSHVPEYLDIEQRAKANGTWLKMPDGSTWEGDPRSWVQLQSKEGRKLVQRPFYHGDSKKYFIHGQDVTPEILGEGVLWSSSNKFLPRTYGNNHYVLSIPNSTEMSSIDAQGHLWKDLSKTGYVNTDDISYNLLKDNNAVEIKNVIDVGSNPGWRAGKEGLPSALPGEGTTDYYSRVFKGNDYIFGTRTPRKSLLGNNGDFNLQNTNIYKTLIPLGVAAYLSDK